MEVIVDDTQLSLAIGKKGQNVRLAAKLLGWRIDIKSEEEKRQEVEVPADGGRWWCRSTDCAGTSVGASFAPDPSAIGGQLAVSGTSFRGSTGASRGHTSRRHRDARQAQCAGGSTGSTNAARASDLRRTAAAIAGRFERAVAAVRSTSKTSDRRADAARIAPAVGPGGPHGRAHGSWWSVRARAPVGRAAGGAPGGAAPRGLISQAYPTPRSGSWNACPPAAAAGSTSRRPSIAKSPSPKASPSRSFRKSSASKPIW
jgi:hypothetical protein